MANTPENHSDSSNNNPGGKESSPRKGAKRASGKDSSAQEAPRNPREALKQELAGMGERAEKLVESGYCESAYQLYGEMRRRAKTESDFLYFVIGTFFQMNLAQRLLQFDTVRERAIELIAILESEEAARKIAPDLELTEYEGLKFSIGPCAYEVLAEATGDQEGFNSEGMQECLTGGIDVCRRIGKLSCIGCFREYACDIHRAADDFELARYHCNQVIKQEEFSDRGDRRWLATLKLASLDILEGLHEVARQRLERAWELAETPNVNDPASARIAIALEQKTLDAIENKPADSRLEEILSSLPPRGECPDYDLDIDCLKAIEHVNQSEFDEAEKLLTPWVRSLKQSGTTTKWLEVGIRLVAVKRLKGDWEAAKRIAAPLELAATKTNDWHAVRRLSQTLDSTLSITPLGTVPRSTKFTLPDAQSASAVKPDNSFEPPKEYDEEDITVTPPGYYPISTDTPLYTWLEDFAKRLQAAREDDSDLYDVEDFRTELVDSQNRDWSHPEDIGKAMFFMIHLIAPGCDYRRVWTWANKLVTGHQETGYLISLLARLGMAINAAERFEQFSQLDFTQIVEELPPSVIESERLDQLVRKSLQLDSGSVNNNFRAGEIFEYLDNLGEAERCYARAFKLDRKREDAALSLARIYMNTERNADAHYVLDLCIREGGSSPELYFEAAMRAHALSMHELQVSYLKTLLEKFPPAPWAYYYLSIGLMELKRPQEGLEAIEQEIEKFKSSGIHIDAIKAEGYALLGEYDRAMKFIEDGLNQSLLDADALTMGGIFSALDRLWRASRLIPDGKALQRRIEIRLLQTGVAPEEYFSSRRAHEKPKDLFLYHVTIVQPLDADWPEFQGCLPEQTDWSSYFGHWGVLATTASEAEEYALEMQRLCYSIEPEIVETSKDEEPLHDRPGVAFQGFRASADDFSDEEGDDDELGTPPDEEMPF